MRKCVTASRPSRRTAMRVRTRAMPPDRFIDRAAGRGLAEAQRQVAARDCAPLQHLNERVVGFGRARDDEQSARVLVEPMDEPGARHERQRRIVREQRVLQCVRRIACARMHDQPGRFVDHQQCLVLVHDAQCDGLGRDGRIGREFCLHACPLAAAQARARRNDAAIEQHGARLDPAL